LLVLLRDGLGGGLEAIVYGEEVVVPEIDVDECG
jgi:hypothetical protein